MQSTRYTKTFIRQVWYRRDRDNETDGGVPQWIFLHEEGAELDDQIRVWVDKTQAIIIHPGQLGIHTQWQDQQLSVKCVTTGLTVLYVEGQDAQRERCRTEEACGPAEAGGPVPFADPENPGGATAGPGTTRTAGAGARSPDAARAADIGVTASTPAAGSGEPAAGGASSSPGPGTEPTGGAGKPASRKRPDLF